MTTISNSIIQQAFKSGNPVIDTDQAVFIWEGESAPYLVGDFNQWDEKSKRFKRISPRLIPDPTKSIWYCTLTLPRDAYIEYAFHDPVTQKNFLDPWNKKSVSTGLGNRNNFFYMPETMASPFPVRRADVTPGALSKHTVKTNWLREDYERDIFFYRPSVKRPVPLLIVFDGKEYLQRAKLNVIVDNLIADKRIQPIAMAFLPNGGRWRDLEYACSDGTILWLDEVILPFANEKLNLLDTKIHPGSFGVLGSSLGGTMSLYTGLRMPDVFGKLISQSGAFTYPSRDFTIVDMVRHGHAREVNIWMDVGQLDFLLEDNRRMKSILTEHGYNFTYRECSGAHNYTTWRNDIWRGLEFMFPGSP